MNTKSFFQGLLLAAGILATSGMQAQNDPPSYQGVMGKTLADSKEWWPQPVKPPAGAPNIVWIILDDVGFGAVISTPTFNSLANNGLRYTHFHIIDWDDVFKRRIHNTAPASASTIK